MKSHVELDSRVDASRHYPIHLRRGTGDLYTFKSTKRGYISDKVAMMHNIRPYVRDGVMAFVEGRAMMAPGCVVTEEAKISLIKFEVCGPMKGSTDMGSERSHRKLVKDLRPELGPGSPIDYALV